VKVNNSTIINKTNYKMYLSFQITEHKKTTAIFFVNLFEMTLNFNTKLECRMCPYK